MNPQPEPPRNDHWFRDWLNYGQSFWIGAGIPILIIAALAGQLLPVLSKIKPASQRQVVLYCAQDQDLAEPILRDFEKETGIQVRTVYDSEAVKTVGLANRLLAERAHPQADVFWGNEEFRTRQLVAAGVFATNDWTTLTGYHRLRMLVVNTNLVKPDALPRSLSELTTAAWRGKVALAYPLFGTTATHFLALRQAWDGSSPNRDARGSSGTGVPPVRTETHGQDARATTGTPSEARWLDWCRALQANQPFVVDGNSVVVNLVGRGEAWIGLTDSDDIAAGQREGLPIAGASLGADTLRIPNTVAIVRDAPHRGNALELAAYLNREDVKQRLARAGAFSPDRPGEPAGLNVDWTALLAGQEPAVEALKRLFLR